MKNLFVFFCLLPLSNLLAQTYFPPNQVWSKFYGGSKAESATFTLPTTDGHFLVVGTTYSNDGNVGAVTGYSSFRSYLWALKLNGSTGAILWKKVYGTDLVNASVILNPSAIAVEGNDAYVIAFDVELGDGAENARMKINKANGNIISVLGSASSPLLYTYSRSVGEGSACIAARPGSGYLLGSPAYTSTQQNARIQVLDNSLLRTATYENLNAVWGRTLKLIVPVADGYLLFGETNPNEAGCLLNGEIQYYANLWVCKLSLSFGVVWSRSYGGVTADFFLDAEQRANGNIVVLGHTPCAVGNATNGPNNVGTGAWLLELSSEGNTVNTTSLSSFGDVRGFSTLKNCDNQIALCGRRPYLGYLSKVLVDGPAAVEMWTRTYDGSNTAAYYLPEDIRETADEKWLAWGAYAQNGNPAVSTAGFDDWITLLNKDAIGCSGPNPCAGAESVQCGSTIQANTANGNNDGQANNYAACAGTLPASATFTGPDKAYRIHVPERSNLRVVLDVNTPAVNLDLFLFGSDCAAGCLAASTEDNVSTGTLKREILERVVEEGEYYIVVDGYNSNQKGDFNLRFECTCACACIEPEGDQPFGTKITGDNFEDYLTGKLAPQSTRWRLFSSAAADGAITSETNGNKLLRVVGSTTTALQPDLLHTYTDLGTNRYRLSFRIKMDTGKNGYFGVLNGLPDANGQNYKYSTQVSFNASGTASLFSGNSTTAVTTFTYIKDTWNDVMEIIDLNKDSVEVWLNGQFIRKLDFSPGSNPKTLAGLNFWGRNGDAYSVDNICLWERGLVPFIVVDPNAPDRSVCTNSGLKYSLEVMARYDLYTSREFEFCANVCDIGGMTIQRGDPYSGKVGPNEAPALSLQSPCVQTAYGGNLPPQLYGEVLVFYNEAQKQVNFNLTGSTNPQTKAFVFSCECSFGNSTVYTIYNVTGVSGSGCGNACLGTLQDFNNGLGQNAPKGFYYVLVLSPVQDNYTILAIPQGPCGGGFTELRCGTTLNGTLTSENNSFTRTSPAYKIYNGFRNYSGRDKIYKFIVEKPSYVDVQLTAPGPMGFFLFSDLCGDNPVTFAETPNSGGTALLDSFYLTPGIYFLSVDEGTNNIIGNATFNLKLDCVEASATTFITQVVFSDVVSCPVDNAQPHEVVIPATALNLSLNDFIQFQYINDGQAISSAEGMGKYWNGGPSMSFILPEDFSGDNPKKCAYRVDDPMQIAITRFDNASYNYSTYTAAYEANDLASGINAGGSYKRGGKSGINRLTPVAVPAFFQVNPSFLNPPNTGGTFSINVKANFDWIIEEAPDQTWITIPTPTGEGTKDRSIVFTAQDAGVVKPREALLKVRGRDPLFQNYVQFVRVVQRGECKTPTVTLSAPTSPICSGSPMTISANPGPNNPDTYVYTYNWSNQKNTRSITETPVVNTATNLTFTVTVTDQNCSSSTQASVTLTVNPVPAKPVATSQTVTYCEGSNPPTLSVSVPAGVAVFWFNSIGIQLTTVATNTFTPSGPGRYLAEPRLGNCKGPKLDIEVIRVAPPTIDAGPPEASICAGQSLQLAGLLTGGANGVRWSDGNAGGTFLPNADVLNAVYHPITNQGSVALKLTTLPASGCVAVSDQIALSVKPVPGALSAAQTLYQYCEGNLPPIISVNNPPAGVSLKWYKANTLLPNMGLSLNPPGPGTYFVEPILNGCAGPQFPIQVQQLAFPTVNAGPNASSCDGQPAALNGNVGGGASAAIWSDGNLGGLFTPNANALNAVYRLPQGAQSAVLTLTTVVANGCPMVSSQTMVSRQVSPSMPSAEKQLFTFCPNNTPVPVAVVVPPDASVAWFGSSGNSLPSSNNGALFNPPGAGHFFAESQLLGCKSPRLEIEVRQLTAPTVNAGPPLTSCSGQPVPLAGAVGGSASAAVWSAIPAVGLFQPDANTLNAVYVPPAVFNGVTLQLSTVAVPGCASVFSQTTVTANSGNSNTPEICGNGLDDDCDGFADETGVWHDLSTDLSTAALTAGERAGFSVALGKDWAIVGAYNWNNTATGRTKAGRVLLYKRSTSNTDQWNFIKHLTASDGSTNDNFGHSVSISGNYIAVGAPNATVNLKSQAGAAYLFFKDQGGTDNWGQLTKLTPAAANIGDFDYFGRSVSISGDYVFVGAQNADDPSLTNSGAAYVFYRDQGGSNAWGLAKRLKSGDAKASDNFGSNVVVDGTQAVVGATSRGDNGLQSGAAYVFVKKPGSADNWVQTDKLLPAALVAQDRFGGPLALEGSFLLVGVPYDDAELGSVYLYERDPTNPDKWLARKNITSPSLTKSAGDRFGSSVSLGGGYAAIGAGLENTGNGPDAGMVYLFQRDQGGVKNWGVIGNLQASDAGGTSSFGNAAAIDGKNLLVGAPGFDALNKTDQGKFYFLKPGCPSNKPDNDVAIEPRTATEAVLPQVECHPVPFSDALTIETRMGQVGLLGNLQIADPLGRTIAILHEGPLEPIQRFTWQPSGNQPGVYYVILSTDKGRIFKPVVYLR